MLEAILKPSFLKWVKVLKHTENSERFQSFWKSECLNPSSWVHYCSCNEVVSSWVLTISPPAKWSIAVSWKISFNPQTFVNGCFRHKNIFWLPFLYFLLFFSIRSWRWGHLLPHLRGLLSYSWDSFHWRWIKHRWSRAECKGLCSASSMM